MLPQSNSSLAPTNPQFPPKSKYLNQNHVLHSFTSFRSPEKHLQRKYRWHPQSRREFRFAATHPHHQCWSFEQPHFPCARVLEKWSTNLITKDPSWISLIATYCAADQALRSSFGSQNHCRHWTTPSGCSLPAKTPVKIFQQHKNPLHLSVTEIDPFQTLKHLHHSLCTVSQH